ncbi:MAG: copper homeostasis protein CutC [Proteobacteria bacterium]|nr:copper homeostasis protein CutC [Pseudomonadota bacterium]
MTEPLFEICVEGVDGLVAAEAGGADRVELCAGLIEGGLTPSLGMVRQALRCARVPFHPIVRPRGGDFLYSAAEYASMLEDVDAMRGLGVAGVVIGCLNADGAVDEGRTAELVRRARPMRVTFHRAFDMARDADAALEALVRSGIDRVLTSGQHAMALEGLETLKRLSARAGDRIVIMGCGGLNPDTIGRVRRQVPLREFHFSAPREEPSGMVFANPQVSMGGTGRAREYLTTRTDSERVRATIKAARAALG